MKTFLSVISTLFLFCSLAAAQQGAPIVTVLPLDTVTVPIGKPAPISFTFRVANGYHINSNKPNSDLLIPTALKLSVPTELMIAKIAYPEGQTMALDFSPNEMVSVYSGDFTVTAMVRPALSSSTGRYRVHGELKYQACTNRQCFPPKSAPFHFDVVMARTAKHKK